MTQSVRKPRRWPWIIGCVVVLGGGFFFGTGAMYFHLASALRAPCPRYYEPLPGEVVFRAGPDMLPPRILNPPRVVVPNAGRLARVNATVQLLFYVEKDGRVSRIAMGRSSGFCPYDLDALNQAREVRFQPGRWQGSPMAGWVQLNVNYRGGPGPERMRLQESPVPASTGT